MLRILHVGLGPLGIKTITDLYERGLGKVVHAVDLAPGLVGQRLKELVPLSKSNVKVADDFRGIDFSGVDAALVTTSSSLTRCAPTFRALLEQGACVVSTCEELAWPYATHKRLAKELDLLAKAKSGRLLGTGVNPGFLMDTFPLVATAVSKSVKSIEVRRFQDAASRRIPFQKKIGVGASDAEFAAQVQAGTLRHVGLEESLRFLAHYLGLPVERVETTLDPVRAASKLTSALGPIAKGAIAGVRQEAFGYAGSKAVVTLRFEASIGLQDPHDRVIVDGEPAIDLVWRGGVQGDIATSAITLNSIRPLRAASPGLHTMATIPLVGFASAKAPKL